MEDYNIKEYLNQLASNIADVSSSSWNINNANNSSTLITTSPNTTSSPYTYSPWTVTQSTATYPYFNGYSSSYSFNIDDKLINDVISKLPTIIQVAKAIIKKGKLCIKYTMFFDKFLPDEGTVYFAKNNLYAIFNRKDDKYWYKYLELTYNPTDLKEHDVKNLDNTYCMLMNDYDIKLDNTELIELCNPLEYKNYAHELLEERCLEEQTKYTKSIRFAVHDKLEKKLMILHD